MKSRNYDTDAQNNIVSESRVTYTRTADPPAAPSSALDPKRPPEMAVLDRLLGEWRHDLTAPKPHTQRAKVAAVLGGRFVESVATDAATGSSDYAIAWFDAQKKQYRQWFFHADGYSFELTGTWDEAAQTLTWRSADGRLEGKWVFKPDGSREFTHAVKTGQGQSEMTGVARRVAADNPRAIVLKKFDPAADKASPLWGGKGVSVEEGAFRIENTTNQGNFHVALGTLLDDVPKDGLIVFRAKVRVKANDKQTWGEIRLGVGDPSFHKYHWPAHLGQYHGDVPEWTPKEIRYPAAVFHQKNPPSIPVYVVLNAAGVVWVKDAEVLHIPDGPAPPPAKPTTEPVKLRTFDPAKDKRGHVLLGREGHRGRRRRASRRDRRQEREGVHPHPRRDAGRRAEGRGPRVPREGEGEDEPQGFGGRPHAEPHVAGVPRLRLAGAPQRLHGDVPEWTQKEVRYPAALFHKKTPPTVTMTVRLYEGVLWLKDVELWHLPANKSVVEALRELAAAKRRKADEVKAAVAAGKARGVDATLAEIDYIEAAVRVAEEERQTTVPLLEQLFARREEVRVQVDALVKSGDEKSEALAAAVIQITIAKARLAKARPAAVGNPLRDKVAALQNTRDIVKQRHDAGVANAGELARAEVDVADARVALAEADGDSTAARTHLEELVKHRRADRDFVAARVNEGVQKPEDRNAAEVRLADARARLVKAQPAPKADAFDATEAKARQERWAAMLGVEVEFADKRTGMEFRVIPPGEFLMGSKPAEVQDAIDRAEENKGAGWPFLVRAMKAEMPQHTVRISRPFAVGKKEVTVQQFREFVKANKDYVSTVAANGGYGWEDGKIVKGDKYTWTTSGTRKATWPRCGM